MPGFQSWCSLLGLALLFAGSGLAAADEGGLKVCDPAPCSCTAVGIVYGQVQEAAGADEGAGLEGLLKDLLRKGG